MPGSGFLDNEHIEFECPECGRKLKTTVGEARRSRTIRCPGGHSVQMEGSQFDRELRKVDDALRRFQ